jgi:hypothetical protein
LALVELIDRLRAQPERAEAVKGITP